MSARSQRGRRPPGDAPPRGSQREDPSHPRRVAQAPRARGRPHDPGIGNPDITEPPFRFSEDIAEISQDSAFGPGVLVPVVHPRLVEPARYQGGLLAFNVPRGGRTLSSSLNIPRRPEDGRALPGPELVHTRHAVSPDGSSPIDLNSRENVVDLVKAGGYAAQHYVDFTGDGAVEVSVPQITRPGSGVEDLSRLFARYRPRLLRYLRPARADRMDHDLAR